MNFSIINWHSVQTSCKKLAMGSNPHFSQQISTTVYSIYLLFFFHSSICSSILRGTLCCLSASLIANSGLSYWLLSEQPTTTGGLQRSMFYAIEFMLAIVFVALALYGLLSAAAPSACSRKNPPNKPPLHSRQQAPGTRQLAADSGPYCTQHIGICTHIHVHLLV